MVQVSPPSFILPLTAEINAGRKLGHRTKKRPPGQHVDTFSLLTRLDCLSSFAPHFTPSGILLNTHLISIPNVWPDTNFPQTPLEYQTMAECEVNFLYCHFMHPQTTVNVCMWELGLLINVIMSYSQREANKIPQRSNPREKKSIAAQRLWAPVAIDTIHIYWYHFRGFQGISPSPWNGLVVDAATSPFIHLLQINRKILFF